MHAPASMPGTRRRLAIPAALRRRPRLPGGRHTAVVLASLAGFLALFGAILLFTPIAHPRTLLVDGVTGPSERQITRLLEDAASKQSTFAVNEDALMRAVAAYPEVAGVEINANPPFKLQLRAIMRPPVARLEVAGRAFVVAGDGTILQRAAEADVPKLDVSAGNLTMRDGHVAGARGALKVLAAAPQPLLAIARTVRAGQAGIEIEMARGPRLVFGNGDQAADKWAAAAAVIADGSANAATYIDLRVPSRPAVGGLGGSKSASLADPPQLSAGATTPGTAATVNGTPGASAGTASPSAGTPSTGTSASSGAAASQSPSSTGTGTSTAPSAGASTSTGAATAPGTAAAPANPAASAPAAGTAAPQGGGAAIGATP